MERYKHFSEKLRTMMGERVQKLSLDGGFSCPNRDGKLSFGGCTFCDNSSFSPDYCREAGSITDQINVGLSFFNKKYPNQKYLAYFQNYSSTYAPLDVIKQRVEEALKHPSISGVILGTRPDTIENDVLDYLQTLATRTYVEIEYGIESTNDAVLASVNRGHNYAVGRDAVLRSAGRGIYIGAHLILGLPGESRQEMMDGVLKVASLPIDVLKLHQLQIIRGTAMSVEYKNNPEHFDLFSKDEYLDFLAELIGKLPANIGLERFVNQVPPRYLIAPYWGMKNYEFTAQLEKKLEKMDVWQGKFHAECGN